jgi:carboxymethylenebutenolidase
MPTTTDAIPTPDGVCQVTLAVPDGAGPWPGVVLYPDAGGTRRALREMAERLAALGYVVALPDVYYRHGDWAPFDMRTVFVNEGERRRLFALMRSVTAEAIAVDARALFGYLASRPEVAGDRFGVTGYCMGGRISLMVAGLVPDRVAAALSFHGGGLVTDGLDSPHLLADQIQAAVYVGGAQDDPSYTAGDAARLDAALTEAGVVHVMEWYPALHGFAVTDNAPYDDAAAALHWRAMADFLGAHLPARQP